MAVLRQVLSNNNPENVTNAGKYCDSESSANKNTHRARFGALGSLVRLRFPPLAPLAPFGIAAISCSNRALSFSAISSNLCFSLLLMA